MSSVYLPVGNTKVLAEKIQKLTGCDVFEIVPEKDYPADYRKCTEVAQDELEKTTTALHLRRFFHSLLTREAVLAAVLPIQ